MPLAAAMVLPVGSEAAVRIGAGLVRVLEGLHLTQAELMRRSGIPQARISQWVAGDKLMMYPQIEQVEKALGVPPGAILAEAGYVEPAAAVRIALANDADLEPFDREYLVQVYDEAKKRSRALRSQSGSDGHGFADHRERPA